jgi:hypothetical protein
LLKLNSLLYNKLNIRSELKIKGVVTYCLRAIAHFRGSDMWVSSNGRMVISAGRAEKSGEMLLQCLFVYH